MDFSFRTVAGAERLRRLSLIAKAVPAIFAAIAASAFCSPCNADDNTGAVRLARFSFLSGSVTWHYGDDTSWANAARNMPLRDGAQIWTSDSSRAEIQFDDGARLRLDSNTLVTLQTLYSDDKGEFTELTLNNGSVHMHLKTRYSIYQINTPYASLKAAGPSRFRATVAAACEFEQFYGSSTIEGNGGSVTLQQGLALQLSDPNAPYQVSPLPAADEWDTWNAARDARIDNPDRNEYLPPDIALECDDLDKHGSWHRDRQYGWVWAPTVTGPDWRPYGAGSWTWVHPFGWTWVSTDTWGWAPYHYGTWIHAEYGWGWVPGPANQYWCPGVVSFHQVNGGIAWVPLAPNEVRYPSALTIGFRSGNWSTDFSIGGAAVYYPGSGSYCEARPWVTAYINSSTFNRNVTNVSINNTYLAGSSFVPSNARYGGGTFVNSQEFGVRGGYQQIRANQASLIANGRAIGAPPAGGRPGVGPLGIKPTRLSFSPDRSISGGPAIPQSAGIRAVFRAPLPKSVPETQIAQSSQRLIAVSANRLRPTPIKRDGSNFTTPLHMLGAGIGTVSHSGTSSGPGAFVSTKLPINAGPNYIQPPKIDSSGQPPNRQATSGTPPTSQGNDRTLPRENAPNTNPPPQHVPVTNPPPTSNPPSGGGGGNHSSGGAYHGGAGSGGSRSGGGGGGSTKSGKK